MNKIETAVHRIVIQDSKYMCASQEVKKILTAIIQVRDKPNFPSHMTASFDQLKVLSTFFFESCLPKKPYSPYKPIVILRKNKNNIFLLPYLYSSVISSNINSNLKYYKLNFSESLIMCISQITYLASYSQKNLDRRLNKNLIQLFLDLQKNINDLFSISHSTMMEALGKLENRQFILSFPDKLYRGHRHTHIHREIDYSKKLIALSFENKEFIPLRNIELGDLRINLILFPTEMIAENLLEILNPPTKTAEDKESNLELRTSHRKYVANPEMKVHLSMELNDIQFRLRDYFTQNGQTPVWIYDAVIYIQGLNIMYKKVARMKQGFEVDLSHLSHFEYLKNLQITILRETKLLFSYYIREKNSRVFFYPEVIMGKRPFKLCAVNEVKDANFFSATPPPCGQPFASLSCSS